MQGYFESTIPQYYLDDFKRHFKVNMAPVAPVEVLSCMLSNCGILQDHHIVTGLQCPC